MTLMTLGPGTSLGPLWDHSGTTLGTLLDHSGTTVRPLWDHSFFYFFSFFSWFPFVAAYLRSFPGHFYNIFDPFPKSSFPYNSTEPNSIWRSKSTSGSCNVLKIIFFAPCHSSEPTCPPAPTSYLSEKPFVQAPDEQVSTPRTGSPL